MVGSDGGDLPTVQDPTLCSCPVSWLEFDAERRVAHALSFLFGIPAVLYRRTEKKRITLHVDPNCSSCSRIWCGGEAIRPSVTEDEAIQTIKFSDGGAHAKHELVKTGCSELFKSRSD